MAGAPPFPMEHTPQMQLGASLFSRRNREQVLIVPTQMMLSPMQFGVTLQGSARTFRREPYRKLSPKVAVMVIEGRQTRLPPFSVCPVSPPLPMIKLQVPVMQAIPLLEVPTPLETLRNLVKLLILHLVKVPPIRVISRNR